MFRYSCVLIIFLRMFGVRGGQDVRCLGFPLVCSRLMNCLPETLAGVQVVPACAAGDHRRSGSAGACILFLIFPPQWAGDMKSMGIILQLEGVEMML